MMRAFVEIRRLALKQNDLKEQLDEIKQRLGEHDTQLNSIYDAIEKTFWTKGLAKEMGRKRKDRILKTKVISMSSPIRMIN